VENSRYLVEAQSVKKKRGGGRPFLDSHPRGLLEGGKKKKVIVEWDVTQINLVSKLGSGYGWWVLESKTVRFWKTLGTLLLLHSTLKSRLAGGKTWKAACPSFLQMDFPRYSQKGDGTEKNAQ